MSSALLHDGYTRSAFVAPLSDERSGQEFHPSLKLEYRPMLVSARGVLMRRIADAVARGLAGVEESEKIAAEAMANQVISWDLIGPTGPVAVSTDAMLKLEPHMSARVFGIVTGTELGDKYEAQEDADVKN